MAFFFSTVNRTSGVDLQNSTSIALNAGATFTGVSVDVSGFDTIKISANVKKHLLKLDRFCPTY